MSSSPYTIGPSVSEFLGSATDRWFYGLRVSDDGTLYVGRVDITNGTDGVTLFKTVPPDNITTDLPGADYFDGQDPATHEIVSDSLNYLQWRWDARLVSYYINDDGEFVAAVGEDRNYPSDV